MAKSESTNRSRRFAALAFMWAPVLTLGAWTFDLVTVAGEDYTSVLRIAIGCATLSIALLAASWKHLPQLGRILAVPILIANAIVLWDAIARLLA